MVKVVYVCSPFRGTPEEIRENIALAKRVSRKAALNGNAVICPHLLYPLFLRDGDEREREIGLRAGLRLLELADELWVVDGRISAGMAREVCLRPRSRRRTSVERRNGRKGVNQ